MRLRVFTRLVAAAGAVVLAAPAFAQTTTDVAVTVTPSGQTRARTAGIAYGGSKTYTVKLTNNGPTHVTSYQLTAAFTAPPAPYNATLKVTPPDGCTPVTAGTDFPCTIDLAATPLLSGDSTTAAVSVELPSAATPAAAPTACPTAADVINATFTVPHIFQGTNELTDSNTANNTIAAAAVKVRPWTDLQYVSLDGPANVSEGETITYTGVVHNAGPCPSTNTFIDFLPPSTLTYVAGSATGCGNPDTFGPADDAGCDLTATDVAVGETKTFSAKFTVNTLPKSVTHAAVPIDSVVSSLSPASSVAATDDPYGGDNELTTQATLNLHNNSSCSTGGAGTLLALLPLVALRLRRRKA